MIQKIGTGLETDPWSLGKKNERMNDGIGANDNGGELNAGQPETERQELLCFGQERERLTREPEHLTQDIQDMQARQQVMQERNVMLQNNADDLRVVRERWQQPVQVRALEVHVFEREQQQQ